MNKSPVVVDACTVINLLRIDEDDFLYKRLKSFNVNIVKEVNDEIRKNVFKNNLDDDRKTAIDNLLPFLHSECKLHKNEDVENDLGTDVVSDLKSFVNHRKEYNGEFYSAMLSLILSRTEESKVVFYTDDYRAKEQLSSLYSFQQIGTIDDTVDLLLTLCSQSENFSESKLEKHLRDLRAEYSRGLKDLIVALGEEEKKLDRKDRKRKIIEKIESVYYEANGDLSQMDLMIKQLGIPKVSKKYKAVSINGYGNDIRIVRKIEATLAYLGKMKLYKVV